ncbi:hypothetical protein RSAG8_00460, partial [Rhizoctonia solani AG-8 WAC10335]
MKMRPHLGMRRHVTNQQTIPDPDRPSGSRRQVQANANSDRMRSPASSTQRGITGSSRHEDTHTNGPGGQTTSGSEPEQARQEGSAARSGSHQDSTSTSTNPTRLPTEATETAPLMGMDVNANPLMSNDGYDSEDIHAKAKDLGLSDYLDSGFTSTW